MTPAERVGSSWLVSLVLRPVFGVAFSEMWAAVAALGRQRSTTSTTSLTAQVMEGGGLAWQMLDCRNLARPSQNCRVLHHQSQS